MGHAGQMRGAVKVGAGSGCLAIVIKRWGPTNNPLRGVPRWRDRFVQYGIKVSFWGSGTLKIVIYVENYPQKRCFRLADYHPPLGWGVLISGHNIYTYHICTYRGDKQRTSR